MRPQLTWPSEFEQQEYWRKKEEAEQLSRTEATTDYFDHHYKDSVRSSASVESNEHEGQTTNLSAVPVLAEPSEAVEGEKTKRATLEGEARESTPVAHGSVAIPKAADSRGGTQNPHLSVEDGKGSATPGKQKDRILIESAECDEEIDGPPYPYTYGEYQTDAERNV